MLMELFQTKNRYNVFAIKIHWLHNISNAQIICNMKVYFQCQNDERK